MYAIFGSDGKPITCASVLPANLLVFKLLTYVIELEILVMGFTLNPANFISSWFKSSRDLYVFRYENIIQSLLLFIKTEGALSKSANCIISAEGF